MHIKARILSILKSARARVVVLILILGLVPPSIFSYVFLTYYRSRSISTDVTDLVTNGQVLARQVLSTGYLSTQDSEQVEELITAMSWSYDGRIMLVNDSLTIVHDTYGVDKGKIIIWSNVLEAFADGSSNYLYDEDNSYLVVTVPIIEEDSTDVIGVLIINRSMTYLDNNMGYFRNLIEVMLVVMFLVAVAMAIVMPRWFVHPLNKLLSEVRKVELGISQEVSESFFTTEGKLISQEINLVLSRMRKVDESRQEFVSNVSHELKTPLTSMKVLADSLIGQEGLPVELYQEFMIDIAAEIDRETIIINDLLSMVKMDKADVGLNIAPTNMNELIESILKRLSPIAGQATVELVYESFRPVMVEIDEVKLSLAITNLVENAIKYNKEGGWVHVSLNADHMYCYIKVEDSGMGIPEESIPHIYERFYRVDKSHSREIGGTGLGLAITSRAITLHNGEIRVESQLGEGTVFSVRLPLIYVKGEEENS